MIGVTKDPKVKTGETLPPEPDLVDAKPKKGRPPGSKTSPELKAKKAKARINFAPFMAMPVPPPEGPGGALKVDPVRDTFGKVAALAPLDGVSKAVAFFDRRSARKTGRAPRKELAALYPRTALAMVQAMFDQVVPLIDFAVHPVLGLCLCYVGTLIVGFGLYMAQDEADEKERNGDPGRKDRGGAGGPPRRGRGPDRDGDRAAGNGQDVLPTPLLRDAGAQAPEPG